MFPIMKMLSKCASNFIFALQSNLKQCEALFAAISKTLQMRKNQGGLSLGHTFSRLCFLNDSLTHFLTPQYGSERLAHLKMYEFFSINPDDAKQFPNWLRATRRFVTFAQNYVNVPPFVLFFPKKEK